MVRLFALFSQPGGLTQYPTLPVALDGFYWFNIGQALTFHQI